MYSSDSFEQLFAFSRCLVHRHFAGTGTDSVYEEVKARPRPSHFFHDFSRDFYAVTSEQIRPIWSLVRKTMCLSFVIHGAEQFWGCHRVTVCTE